MVDFGGIRIILNIGPCYQPGASAPANRSAEINPIFDSTVDWGKTDPFDSFSFPHESMNNPTQPLFTFDDAVRGIRKRKFLVLGILVLVPTLVMVVTLLSPKEYESTAKLFVRLGRENSSLDATATLGQGPVVSTPLTREAEIKSIAEMIMNRSLYEKVVDEIGPEVIMKKKRLTADGSTEEIEDSSWSPIDTVMGFLATVGIASDLPIRERAINRLEKDLYVEAVENSNVVFVKYESYDPALSQKVVESLTRHYILTHGEINRAAGARTFMDEQTRRMKSELEAYENEFEKLKSESGVIDLDAYRGVLVDRLSNLTNQKIEVDAQVQAIEEEVIRLQDRLDNIEPEIVLEEMVGAGNEGADGMRQELYRLELQKEDLLARFAPTHVKVKAIEKQIANAKKILVSTEQARKESKRGPNEIYQKLAIDLNTRIPQLESLKAKAKAYAEQIAAVKQQQQEFARLEVAYKRLERQISIDDGNYRKYVNNLEQARLDSQLKNEKLSNISLAQPASLQLKPSKPNKLLNLIVGIVFGIMIGFGLAVYLEFRSVMAGSGTVFERESELPLVGSLESIPPGLQNAIETGAQARGEAVPATTLSNVSASLSSDESAPTPSAANGGEPS